MDSSSVTQVSIQSEISERNKEKERKESSRFCGSVRACSGHSKIGFLGGVPVVAHLGRGLSFYRIQRHTSITTICVCVCVCVIKLTYLKYYTFNHLSNNHELI